MPLDVSLEAKLRKIEALHAGAATPGERDAAAAALDRIRARLAESQKAEEPVELQFSLGNQWSRRLFLALCRRYGLEPYRYKRQRLTTVMVRLPRSFCDEVLWPEFTELDRELHRTLDEVTETLLREAVFEDSSEAAERDPLAIGAV